jgi:hypothetical protein
MEEQGEGSRGAGQSPDGERAREFHGWGKGLGWAPSAGEGAGELRGRAETRHGGEVQGSSRVGTGIRARGAR